MNRFRAALIGLALLGAAAATFAQGETDWSRIYLEDLEVARRVITEDHPGPVDSKNPEFRRALESAYEEAKSAAPQVKSFTSYAIALTRFGNRFQDAHLAVMLKPRPLEGVRAAGIFPVWRGDAFVIEEVDARYGERAAALEGATIVSCDGAPAARLFTDRVLSWRGRPSIKADWFLWAPLLLVDYGPPTPKAPAQCSLRAGSRTETVALQWKETTPEEVRAAQERLMEMPARPLRVSKLADGTIWVDIPTFQVNEEGEISAMRGMIDSLAAELKENHDWKLLVFDLRGNRGGSEVWGDEIAAALFGKDWLEAARKWLDDGRYTEWRISKDNIESIQGIAEQQEKRHGKDNPSVAATRKFAESMRAALAEGRSLIGEDSPAQGVPRPPAAAVPGKIVVVTSASCYSACLDFMDRMRLHPAVVHVGQPTGVDTVYMESWGQGLPSGLGSVSYPMKVVRNRKRGNNEAYTPKVEYTGRLADTEALRKWINANYRSW
jgi:Peptidase family S41